MGLDGMLYSESVLSTADHVVDEVVQWWDSKQESHLLWDELWPPVNRHALAAPSKNAVSAFWITCKLLLPWKISEEISRRSMFFHN